MQHFDNYVELAEFIGAFLPNIHTGKVRDSFRLPDREDGEKRRLVVVSDRVSIYDFVLANTVMGKGEMLNAYNLAARGVLRRETSGFEDDLTAYGSRIDEYLPEGLCRIRELQARAVVVRELSMVPCECVVRGHLTGSAYVKNLAGQLVCGHDIGMRHMQEGSRLIPPIFTPTTKAEVGHDLDLDYKVVEETYGGIGAYTINLYLAFYEYARVRGIIIADTKLEVGYVQKPVPRLKRYILGDEAFTPDSSRFWDSNALDCAFTKKELPPSLDKQPLRNWGAKHGINLLDPKNAADRAMARATFAPEDVVDGMMESTRVLFERLYDMSIADYQANYMELAA